MSITGHTFTNIYFDEVDPMNAADKKRNIELFLGKPYKYDTYFIEGGHTYEILDLIKEGLLKGHALHVKGYRLHGYIGVTELGKTWLEFNEL